MLFVMKKNKVLTHVTIQINYENITLSERIKSQKTIYDMAFFP